MKTITILRRRPRVKTWPKISWWTKRSSTNSSRARPSATMKTTWFLRASTIGGTECSWRPSVWGTISSTRRLCHPKRWPQRIKTSLTRKCSKGISSAWWRKDTASKLPPSSTFSEIGSFAANILWTRNLEAAWWPTSAGKWASQSSTTRIIWTWKTCTKTWASNCPDMNTCQCSNHCRSSATFQEAFRRLTCPTFEYNVKQE